MLDCPSNVRKGRRRSKRYFFRPPTLEAVLQLNRDHDEIFAWDRSMHAIYHHVDQIMERAGLPHGPGTKDWKFHLLRRTHASHLAAAGGNAQQSLGHASSRTTDRYLSPRIVRPHNYAEILPNVSKGGWR